MRSLASPSLPLYLSIGALCAGIGIQVLSPFSGGTAIPSPLPRLSSILPAGAERLAILQNSLTDEAKTLWAKTSSLGPRTESIVLRRGDTLTDVLERAGLDRSTATSLVAAVHTIYNPKRLHAGQAVELTYNPLATESENGPMQLAFEVAPGRKVAVERQVDGAYEAKNVVANTRTEMKALEGTITSSLFEAAESQHMPADVLAAMIKMFSYDIDFQRDLQRGDRFSVMYDRQVTEDGRSVSNGAIRYASISVGGTPLKLYAFRADDGEIEYYNEKGEGSRKALLRTPVNGATLTSSFGMRKHPILGYSIMHRGVDFGAPIGTPIMAAGDGTVDKRETSSTYGNYVRIRHGSGYYTAYAHMSRFGSGVASGKRVRQGDIIGYVGQTGRATGPHLHFEVLKDLEQVNPITVKFPAAQKLEGALMARFNAAKVATQQAFAEFTTPAQVAAAPARAEQTPP